MFHTVDKQKIAKIFIFKECNFNGMKWNVNYWTFRDILLSLPINIYRNFYEFFDSVQFTDRIWQLLFLLLEIKMFLKYNFIIRVRGIGSGSCWRIWIQILSLFQMMLFSVKHISRNTNCFNDKKISFRKKIK